MMSQDAASLSGRRTIQQAGGFASPLHLRWEYVVLALIIALGAAARLQEIGYNFDGDELFSIRLANSSFAQVIEGSLRDTPHPPLHNVLLHGWVKTFGPSEASARSLSIVFSLGFLLLSYALLRRLVSPWLALGLLCVLALSPLFVYYGQQARPYALIAALSAANLLAFLRVLERAQARGPVLAWGVSCALLVYAQYLAIIVILIEVMAALALLKKGRLQVLMGGIAGISLIVPWMLAAMGISVLGGKDPLPHIAWIEVPTLKSFIWFYVTIFGDRSLFQPRWILLLIALLGAIFISRRLAAKDLSAEHTFLLCVALGFPLIVFLLSVLGPKPIFAGRQLLGAAIALIALVGLWLSTLPSAVSAAVVLLLAAYTATAVPNAFPHNTKPPWRGVAEQMDSGYGTDTIVASENWVFQSLGQYRKSGQVRLLRSLSAQEQAAGFLFMCRPARCAKPLENIREDRLIRIKAWHWGPGEPLDHNQLFLYRIAPER